MDILKSSTLRTRRYRERLKAKGEQNKRDLAKEREAKRHKSALSKGFASWDEYQAFKAQTKKPKQLPKKRVTGHDGVCWLWERPGLSAAEKFAKRYSLDQQFAENQRLRSIVQKTKKRIELGVAVCWLWQKPGLTELQRHHVRKKLDMDYAAASRIKNQCRQLSADLRAAIKMKSGSRASFRNLGYTAAQLRQHIERQFVDGMTWDAFNQGDIHIDHIIPKAAFDLSDFEQWRKCWCMSNLRPLWAKDNVSKGAELMFLV
jgi:hypothetical protein